MAVAGVLLVFTLLVRGSPRTWLAAVLALALSDLAGARVLKPLVDRPRPCRVAPELAERAAAVGATCGSGSSFPSNHAANTAALAAAAASWPLAGVAALAGASRVVLAEHYPSDVVAGWILGAGVGLGLRAALRCPSAPSSSTPRTRSSAPGSR